MTIFTPAGSDGSISFEPLLHAVDHVERVLAAAHHDDAAHGVALAVEVGDAPPDLGSERHAADVARRSSGVPFSFVLTTILPMSEAVLR